MALLKLESKIKFSTFDGTVAPVCIPEEMTTYNGETVTVAGWGLQEENSNKITDKVSWRNTCKLFLMKQFILQYFSSRK